MKHSTHHWHMLVEPLTNTPTGGVLEHEHQVNRGRRHAHYLEHDQVLRELLANGTPEGQARLQAFRLDGCPQGSLDLTGPPDMARATELPEALEVARLHPEVRRSLSSPGPTSDPNRCRGPTNGSRSGSAPATRY